MTQILFTKEDLIKKSHEIAHMIANTPEVEFFKRQKLKSMKINKYVNESQV